MPVAGAKSCLVDGKLFLSTPYNHVIALDPRTGAKLWEYDAALDLSHGYSEVTSRGVAAWGDPAAAPGRPCRTRIFMGTLDARLVALDGDTGTPCADFGDRSLPSPGECLELLSLVAWSGSGDAAQARAALHAATRELGTGDRWNVIPREKLGASLADAALRRLGDGSADVRRRVLRSCAAAAFADGRVTGAEAELLRVVASFLGFAIPPVLPGALSTDWVDSRKWRTGIPN